MRFLLIVLISGAALSPRVSSGQMMPGGGGPGGARYQQSYDDVKAALNLTDEQVTQLKQLQTDKMSATQAFYAKMADKQKELNAALESSAGDPTTVGRLMLELQQLRKQPPTAGDVHEKALALLKPEQKEKLAKLEEAQKMRTAVDQATGLALLTPPPPAAPRGMPAGAPAAPKAPSH
jgi:Spy/CpxP family protein refolding chaperone